MTEDEMAGWHHQLYGSEFEQALGVSDGQGSLAWRILSITLKVNELRKSSVLWYIMCILLFLCIVKIHIIGRKIEYFEKWKNSTK